jgi:hypothetical protein
METAMVTVQAIDSADVDVVLPKLRARLEEPGYPPVEIITVSSGILRFQAHTWTPILRVRVEDAMESVLGAAWRGRFEWAS